MKILFNVVLVLNLLLEGLAAVSLIAGPTGMGNIQPDTGMWAMNYGFAALAIATTIIWIWPNRDNYQAVGAVLGILSTFHIGLFISLVVPGVVIVGIVAHGIMAVLCVLLFTQRAKWCET